jgi:CubicO group peptidase (beta-lactamase class C family)
LHFVAMKNEWIIALIVILGSTGCKERQLKNTAELAQIAGCWEGGQTSPYDRPYLQRNYFSWRPDSSLALSMIYELGPRSRVWSFDIDVTVTDGKIRWDYHEGVLSENKDTMTVVKDYGGEKSVWRFIRCSSADSLMAELHNYAREPYRYEAPEHRDDGWACADMSERGVERRRIVQLIEQIRSGKHGDIHSLLIAKDGSLIVEEYFAANGTKYGPLVTRLFRNRVHHLASTTKSVTSTLVGIAIDQGFIKSVEDPIYPYLPAYGPLFSEDKKRIRICDMLTMTPGFKWRQFGVSEAENDGMQMFWTDDVIRYVLQKPLEAEPGKKFNYTNGVPTVTGAIIKNAVGMEVGKFAEKYLFHPLGISEYAWTRYPDGSIETDGGLALRSRDLAKIGRLFLNNGEWNGKRIVSEQWVRESTKERLKFGSFFSGWGYGYHWMQRATRVRNREVRSYFVPGDGNQILAVFPDLGMVVVFTAGNYGKDPKPIYYSLFENFILPAVIPEG